MVRAFCSQSLQIGRFEVTGCGFDAGHAYYARVGGTGEKGREGVYEEVVPEEIGTEDLPERRLWRAFFIVGWQLGFRNCTDGSPGESWVGDGLDGVNDADEEGFGPVDDPIAGDAGIQDYYIDFGKFREEAL